MEIKPGDKTNARLEREREKKDGRSKERERRSKRKTERKTLMEGEKKRQNFAVLT